MAVNGFADDLQLVDLLLVFPFDVAFGYLVPVGFMPFLEIALSVEGVALDFGHFVDHLCQIPLALEDLLLDIVFAGSHCISLTLVLLHFLEVVMPTVKSVPNFPASKFEFLDLEFGLD